MENKTEESIIVTIDDTEGNSRDFVQDMVYRLTARSLPFWYRFLKAWILKKNPISY